MIRACFVCSATLPPEGEAPYSWDSHNVKLGFSASGKQLSEMRMTCSPACRAKAGLPERKAVV